MATQITLLSVAGILAGMGTTARPGRQGNNASSDRHDDDIVDDDEQGQDDSTLDEESSEELSKLDDEVFGSESRATSSHEGSAWSFPESDDTNWNPIIPRSSWAVPVGNTPYASSPAVVTPRPEGATTTLDQQTHRLAALRTMLGEPSGVTNTELRAALEGSRWDMGSALRFMNHRFNEARRLEQENQRGRDAPQLERDRLLGADSLHHNRRRAVDALYQRLISAQAQPTARLQLTSLNVGLLLAEHRFDLDEAVGAFHE